jgi:flavine halogenase
MSIDESGWAWFIPLNDGTHSVGVVMNQAMMKKKKSASVLSAKEFYLSSLELAPRLNGYLSGGELVTEVKSASDYSYNSSSYAFPYARIVGDAGCFIDPFFSSGVHLAITGALSAAATICAAIRCDCDEETAGKWHSNKVKEGYSRWLLVVLSAYKQMCNQGEPILSDFGEDNFDRAFNFFKPSKFDLSCLPYPASTGTQPNLPLLLVIQGTADVSSKLTQSEFSKALDFVVKAFDRKGEVDLTNEEEQKVFNEIRTTQSQNMDNIQSFTMDVIDGRLPRLERGNLGLNSVAVVNGDSKHSATVTTSSVMPEQVTLGK